MLSKHRQRRTSACTLAFFACFSRKSYCKARAASSKERLAGLHEITQRLLR